MYDFSANKDDPYQISEFSAAARVDAKCDTPPKFNLLKWASSRELDGGQKCRVSLSDEEL